MCVKACLVLLAACIGFAVSEVELWSAPYIRTQDIPSADWSYGLEERLVTEGDDPNGGDFKVLNVTYPEGSYKPSDRSAPRGGAQFFVPLSSRRTTITLTYNIFFANNFDFVKGGKLPGLFGGNRRCSGGRDSTQCFSTRYMFRAGGAGEIYLYAPDRTHQVEGFCNNTRPNVPEIKCNANNKGHSLGRGTWKFEPGKWHKISQRVRLNTPGQQNGYVKVWVNDELKMHMPNLVFRLSTSIKIEGMYFSTFFGGNDNTWATPVDTWTAYYDFKMTT